MTPWSEECGNLNGTFRGGVKLNWYVLPDHFAMQSEPPQHRFTCPSAATHLLTKKEVQRLSK